VEEGDSEEEEASASSERTAILLCVNGAARSETALLQMALHERGIATISIEPAMQESPHLLKCSNGHSCKEVRVGEPTYVDVAIAGHRDAACSCKR
jgi:hypothetical protein